LETWRFALIFGIGGLLISVLSAVIGGVDFLTLLLRAVLSGLLSAGFGAGIVIIVQRFMPELISSDSAPVMGRPAGGTGESVDIVVDEDVPTSGMFSGQNSSDGDDESLPFSPDAFVEEVEEVTSSRVNMPRYEDSTPSAVSSEVFTDVDTLPDMEGMSRSFGSVTTSQSSMPSSDSGSIPAGSENSATMAKAIQTILRKDHEG